MIDDAFLASKEKLDPMSHEEAHEMAQIACPVVLQDFNLSAHSMTLSGMGKDTKA